MLSILSRWLIQFCLYSSLMSCIPEISSYLLMISLLILSNLAYPVTLHRKRISAASRPVLSPFVVTHVSLPYISDGLATSIKNFIWVSVRVFFKCFLTVPHIPWNLFIWFSIRKIPDIIAFARPFIPIKIFLLFLESK